MPALSSLVVELQLNHAQLKKGVDDANAKLRGMEQHVKKLSDRMRSVSAGAAVQFGKQIVVGLTHFIMKGAEAADAMGKLAQATGVPVEALSRLNYAAKLSDVSTEELGVALGKLNKKMSEAATGGKDQVALFQALGVSVTDAGGKVRGTEAVLGDLAERFSRMDAGASKTALAMEVFGKSGAKLIPFLNAGKAGLAELAAEADRLGITISEKTAAGAERFNDVLTKFDFVAKGVAQQVAGRLAPGLANLGEELLKTKNGVSGLSTAVTFLTNFFKVLISGGLLLKGALQAIGASLAFVAASIVATVSGNMGELAEIDKAFVTDLKNIASSTKDEVAALWNDDTAVADAFKRQTKASVESADAILKNMARIKKEMAEFNAQKDFELAQNMAGIDRGAATRRTTFGNIGRDKNEVTRAKMGGFGNFDQALEAYAEATRKRATWTDEATRREKNNDHEGARAATAFANKMGVLAETADHAALAFEDYEQAIADATVAQKTAVDGLVGYFAKKLGTLGDVASSAMQGYQAGGVWGAVIAAIAELVSGSVQFMGIVESLNAILGDLGDSLGDGLAMIQEVVAGIAPLFEMIGKLIGSVISFLNAASGVGTILGVLEPIVEAVGFVIEIIITIVDVLTDIISSLSIFKMVMVVVEKSFNFASLTILGTMNGIMLAWGWILGVVHGFLKAIRADTSGIEKLAGENAANVKETQDKMTAIWLKMTNGATEAGKEINTPVADLGFAAGGAAESLEHLGDTADRVSEQLTNVPAGYKVALARFNATLEQTSTDLFGDLVDKVRQSNERETFTMTGNPYKGSGGGKAGL